jgi:hypothetical protein
MEEERRDVVRSINDAWKQATHEADPVAALEAFTELRRHLARWQETLVSQAISAGATWDEIGDATGTSRQAAWGRFRKLTGERNGGSAAMHEKIGELNRRVTAESKQLQERLKALNDKWRKEQRLLQDQVQGLTKQIAQDRKALQEEIRQKMSSIREEIHGLSRTSKAS